MNKLYVKAQQELIKALSDSKNRVFYENINGIIWISVNGTYAYAIPKTDFFLDLEKLKDRTTNVFSEILKKDYKPATQTNDFKVIFSRTKPAELAKIGNSDFTVWVDNKTMKLFGSGNTFKVSNTNGAVLIYSSTGIPLGLIMPVRVKE